MKNIVLILVVFALFGSRKDKIQQRYMANSPVYTDYEAFRNSGGFEAAKSIEQK